MRTARRRILEGYERAIKDFPKNVWPVLVELRAPIEIHPSGDLKKSVMMSLARRYCKSRFIYSVDDDMNLTLEEL